MQKWSIQSHTPVSVGFLLFERFSNMCLANCVEPMRAANTLGDRQVYDWAFVGLNQGVVTSSSQLSVLTDYAIADAPQFDYLFVIASYDYDTHDTPATRRALAKVSTLDAIVPVSKKQGDVIIKQGDEGDSFYILEKGALTCSKFWKPSDK